MPFLVCLGIVGTATSALASGFAILEQSVRGLGNAFSGGAIAEDASTIFFNPAGLTRLSGSSVSAAVYYISPSAVFQNTGSTIVTGARLSGVMAAMVVLMFLYPTCMLRGMLAIASSLV